MMLSPSSVSNDDKTNSNSIPSESNDIYQTPDIVSISVNSGKISPVTNDMYKTPNANTNTMETTVDLNSILVSTTSENKETPGINFKTDTTGTSLGSSSTSDSSPRRRPPPPPPKKSPSETKMKESIPLPIIITPDSPPTRRPPPPPPTPDLPPRRRPPPPPPHLHRHARSQNPETRINVEQENYINLSLPMMRHAHVKDWLRRYQPQLPAKMNQPKPHVKQPQPHTETLLHKETKPYTNVDTKREPIEPIEPIDDDEYIDMTEFRTSFPHPHAYSQSPPPLPPARKPNKIQRAFSNQDLYIHRESPNSPVVIKHKETHHDEKGSQNLDEDEDEEYIDMSSLNIQEPYEDDDVYESIDVFRHRLPPIGERNIKRVVSSSTTSSQAIFLNIQEPSTSQSSYEDDAIYETIDVSRPPILPPRRERNTQRVVSSSPSSSHHTYIETSLTRPNMLQKFQSLDSPDNNDSFVDNYVIMQKQ